MNSQRTLPIRVLPLPGEALDSWFEAIAHRLHTPLGELMPQLGLTRRLHVENHLMDIPLDWTILLREHEAAVIADVTGTNTKTIRTMTLEHYHQRALQIDRITRRVVPQVLWGRSRGSRFCSDCLAADAGRWRLLWRLGWAFACPAHNRLLADLCPDCRRVQRKYPHAKYVVPQPGLCANPVLGIAPRAGTARCGGILTAAEALPLIAPHPALTAQRLLFQTIDTGTAQFGIYADDPQPALTMLSDARALASHILNSVSSEHLKEFLPEDLLNAYESLLALPSKTNAVANPPSRLGATAPPSAITTAIGLTAAINILIQPSIRQAGHALGRLITTSRQHPGPVSPSTLRDWGSGTSAAFKSVQLAAIGPMLRPSDQLRHRVASSKPDSLEEVSSHVLRRSRSVPTMLWPAWSLRISPVKGTQIKFMRPALSCVLLMVGNRLEYSDTTQRLGAAINTSNISRVLQGLQVDPHWRDILTALIRLAESLDEHPAPIDYSRRRSLDYSNVLPDSDWADICQRIGMTVGKGVRIKLARCLLFERLSGLPADLAPPSFATTNSVSRSRLANFTRQLTPDLLVELNQIARRFLSEMFIHEPISWQPPIDLLQGLTLPGPDLEEIDLKVLHDLIRTPKVAISQVADSLGTTIETVRRLLEEHPAIPTPMTVHQARAIGDVKRWARTVLQPDEFARLYYQERLSLQHIAAKHGIGRKVTTALAYEYGIITRQPGGPKPRAVISREWLYDQHVNHRRTLVELAQETGMSSGNMSRWAKKLKIPVRTSGGLSHSTTLNTLKQAETMPRILQRVLTGAGAWERLDRFAAVAAYPSMKAGAAALDINASSLVLQINRLEKELGGPVFRRANHGRPMQPTPLGQQLLSAINDARSAAEATDSLE
ncbi:TniQ family protein [Streptosporangium amethystogenes]|uniref:TniQ family protein n=1 Tax=Streptosporangium amethystogenes TaxID=2002 RepID=UPI0009FD8990|nr:TniQ family protein [Streptosporangium amethystogenes]